jgi:hypothetical protein
MYVEGAGPEDRSRKGGKVYGVGVFSDWTTKAMSNVEKWARCVRRNL